MPSESAPLEKKNSLSISSQTKKAVQVGPNRKLLKAIQNKVKSLLGEEVSESEIALIANAVYRKKYNNAGGEKTSRSLNSLIRSHVLQLAPLEGPR
jgi:hypothetical protein